MEMIQGADQLSLSLPPSLSVCVCVCVLCHHSRDKQQLLETMSEFPCTVGQCVENTLSLFNRLCRVTAADARSLNTSAVDCFSFVCGFVSFDLFVYMLVKMRSCT
ncbi:hypothetical protein JOB18_007430 [Solea senegalensis]|uniref:Uncharacterized protein n=1 Tax=Solea senegalensis TaxID=28829 RepID=A0AAV6PVM8_SOLSE|nr:hypothetical protein JOB18_007430 [Solea senegalensis]KAG7478753.1 hypothetical protein JOB18_007430 [Solea senegalensis]KAG7478754.1 hypothetical protein JOB18_007430 [Solea senegalensis]KAG7478755.1 hypothetical protein JOB18_007430 [Solea senegalensis]KAG7478756.1 hypothetical protein JOB18_007430 [Solea senegalensis]